MLRSLQIEFRIADDEQRVIKRCVDTYEAIKCVREMLMTDLRRGEHDNDIEYLIDDVTAAEG